MLKMRASEGYQFKLFAAAFHHIFTRLHPLCLKSGAHEDVPAEACRRNARVCDSIQTRRTGRFPLWQPGVCRCVFAHKPSLAAVGNLYAT